MKIELSAVSKGPHSYALPSTTLRYQTGAATLARAETEQRPTVLGLIASGRMRPDAGSVTIDDDVDFGTMRRRIALVDAPGVSEPAGDVTVAGVTAEELMFAGLPSHPRAVARMLAQLDAGRFSRQSIGTVPPTERIRLLTELALLRDDVDGVVITSPDRHGGDPAEWWRFAREVAGRGIAVLVIAGDASAGALELGATAQCAVAATPAPGELCSTGPAIAATGLVERLQSTEDSQMENALAASSRDRSPESRLHTQEPAAQRQDADPNPADPNPTDPNPTEDRS